ncbi:MAG: MFS transporter [Bryobacterales bacterium]|nr:MFS transporter [Bryobacterales bacterium]
MSSPPARPQSLLNPWLLVALLWVVGLLNYLDRQVVFSLFPLLQEEFSASGLELGLISTVFLWVYGLVSPFAGYLADRFGRLRVILISLAVWSVATWVTGHVSSIPEMLWARAVMGISEACYIPAALALIVEVHSERSRSLAVGLHQSGLYTGMILGGVWGGWMGDNYGWRPVFTILGAIGLSYLLVLWLVLRRRVPRTEGDAERPRLLHSLESLAATPGFISLTMVFAGLSVANWLVYTWLPTFLFERFNLNLTEAGFTATFYVQIASYTGILLGGLLADRWAVRNSKGRIYTQAIGLLAAAPFLFLVGLTSLYPLLVAALIVFGLGRGLYDCNAMPVLSQIAPPHLRATGYGIFNLAGCLVGGVTAAFAGFFKQAIGLSAAFQLAAVVALLCGLLLLRVNPPRQESDAPKA